MPLPIEDYAVIGDTQTAALVGRDGSIDWLCLPRFDSGACFAALLGEERHGRWLLAPAGPVTASSRRYLEGTLVLETKLVCADGEVRVVDCMPPRQQNPDVVRVVEGVRGRVAMRMELIVRPDYGAVVPWVRRVGGALSFVAGPDAFELRTPVETRGRDFTTVAEFSVGPGDRVPFVLTWHPSHEPAPPAVDGLLVEAETETWWRHWHDRCAYEGGWGEAVERSLLTLKALTYAPTGGIVAAATTSLPEELGGVRNWDYRFCWLRDATFTLYALMLAGYVDEAAAWRDWLLRAVAGHPADLRIMYGVAGERRLPELVLDWLPGYEGSWPVRTGNDAAHQFQLDVYGEVMDCLHTARRQDVPPDDPSWAFQLALMEFLESAWKEPDQGIWETRGQRQHYTHSKVMAWVAADRAVKAVERVGRQGPVDRWRALRDEIRAEVLERGYDAGRNTFTRAYGSVDLDGSLLLLPLVGFIPASDPRMVGTVEAVRRELCDDGLVHRYLAGPDADGLPGREGAFLACSFWLADNLTLQGRHWEAQQLFERLLSIRNDVGLLSEEYDVAAGRMVGNFPQAFSHVSLINTARNLSRSGGPADRRKEG